MNKVEEWEDIGTGEVFFKFTFNKRDFASVKLTEFDRIQLSSPKSKETPVADQLLDLELMVRRIEEQLYAHPNPSPDASDGGGE